MNARTLAAALGLVASVSFVAPSSAAITSNDVQRDVDAATSNLSPQVHVTVENDIVTLSGAANPFDNKAAEQAARQSPGVSNVINHISVIQK